MEMTKNLGMFQEVFPGSPGLGHMPRAISSQDSTDGGIVERLQMAVQQGMISPQAAQYLMENLLDSDEQSRAAVRPMPRPQNMPPMSNTFPFSLKNGLLE